MKKIIIVFVLAAFGLPVTIEAQTVLDGIYVKENVQTRRMIPYTYLREADVMWSKRIWRVIDLNEKMNLALRYPLSETTSDRKNLIDLLMHSVNEGSLTAYSTLDDEFTLPMTSEEIEKIGNSGVDTTWVTEPDPPYETKMVVVEREFSYDKIIAFRIKEEWFFDKERSVMDVRIIGIAPMMYSEDEFGNVREGAIKVPIFWIYYPEARKILANNEVFNRHNDAERLSFDDVFQKRLFSSYIFKESNVFDRRIESYKQGINALLEAERIKNEIFEMEHDLWEY
ncbi:MAG: gliding motility protein GldN [Bacteroidia bacterium]